MKLDEAWAAVDAAVAQFEAAQAEHDNAVVLRDQRASGIEAALENLARDEAELQALQQRVTDALGPLEAGLGMRVQHFAGDAPEPGSIAELRKEFDDAREACAAATKKVREREHSISQLRGERTQLNAEIVQLAERQRVRARAVAKATEQLVPLLHSAVAGLCPRVSTEADRPAEPQVPEPGAARTRTASPASLG